MGTCTVDFSSVCMNMRFCGLLRRLHSVSKKFMQTVSTDSGPQCDSGCRFSVKLYTQEVATADTKQNIQCSNGTETDYSDQYWNGTEIDYSDQYWNGTEIDYSDQYWNGTETDYSDHGLTLPIAVSPAAYTDLKERNEIRQAAWEFPGWDECVIRTGETPCACLSHSHVLGMMQLLE